MDRIYEPSVDQCVYHYCSAESFRAILESGALRFSDINMLNDPTEHRWGYSIFEKAATRLIKRIGISDQVPTMPVQFFDAVDEILSRSQLIAHPFISCLSLEGNSLDQWRKYADDGRGYAIGFRASALKHLPISLLQVLYDEEKQVLEMMAALVAVHAQTPEPNKPLDGIAKEDAAFLSVLMVTLKHPSFASEYEVRCVRAISLEKIGSNFRFSDLGGQAKNGKSVPGEKVCFDIRSGALTAHVDIPFTLSEGECPIAEVALGPKNETGLGNVFLFLGGLGHSDIAVRPSGIPYR